MHVHRPAATAAEAEPYLGGGAAKTFGRHAALLERRTSRQNDPMVRDPVDVFSGPHGSMVEEPSQSSEFRGGGSCGGAPAARWSGHPPLQTVAQGHHTLGEPREERALAPKHLDAEERLVRQPESALVPAPRVFDLAAFCVPSRLPQLGQESLEHLQAQEGAHAEERSRLGSGRMAAADAAADADAEFLGLL